MRFRTEHAGSASKSAQPAPPVMESTVNDCIRSRKLRYRRLRGQEQHQGLGQRRRHRTGGSRRRRQTASGLASAANHRRAGDHSAAARRLPQAGQSAVVGARTARSGRGSAPGNRGLGDPGHQAGVGFFLRLSAWAVRRHRPAGRRTLAVAVVLADVEPCPRQSHHHDHGQGHARGVPVDPPGRRGGARHDRSTGCPAGQLRDARPRTAPRCCSSPAVRVSRR